MKFIGHYNNKVKLRLSMAALLCLCSIATIEAKVKLPVLISDGMVWQRNQPIKVWGTADAGETVNLNFEKKAQPSAVKGGKLKKSFNVTADHQGKWCIELPALQPGGPYVMHINETEVKNILVGDVWLCSGQSNMELPVRRVTDKFADEIASYTNGQIRHITIPKEYNFHAPQEDISATGWKELNQDNVMNFSALAYFFAKDMYEKTGIPVGLVNASWGGTPVEAWISEKGLKEFPQYINDKRQYEDDAYCRHIKEVEGESFQRWALSLYRGDIGLHESTPWFSKEYNDDSWETVNMFDDKWGNNGLNPIGGSHWFRQDIELSDLQPDTEATLRLGCIVDADSVYVNGVFVGNTTYQYPPRIYTLPAGVLKAGKNNITVRLISNGGQPSFVQEKPYKIIYQSNSSEGKKEINLSASWKYRLGAPMPSAPAMTFFCYKPICLYNAMIAPLKNYTVKGAVWYQGESNVSRRNEYAALLRTMITDWRETFGKADLPFYIVELADFLSKDDTNGRKAWAEMRKEQAKVAETMSNTWLIKNSDLGEWNDIHPLDKKTLGKRVADAVWDNQEKNKQP